MADFDILTTEGVRGLRNSMRALRHGYPQVWYCVTYGYYHNWDEGSANLTEAIRIARSIINDSRCDGMAVDILCIDVHNKIDPFCLGGFSLRDAAEIDCEVDNE